MEIGRFEIHSAGNLSLADHGPPKVEICDTLLLTPLGEGRWSVEVLPGADLAEGAQQFVALIREMFDKPA